MKKEKCIIYFGFNNPLKFKRGVENVILFQTQSLEKNIEKYYVFFDDENVEFTWNGISCIGIKKNKFRFFDLNKLINKRFKNKKYIIHSHNYLMSFFLLKKTDIFTVHDGLYYQSSEINHKLKNLFKYIEKKVYKKSKLVHFISKFSKEKSLYSGSNFKIIYNTTPFEKISKKNFVKNNWKSCKLKIFTVRSIEERANIELLIELAKRNKNYDIKIAGKGPLLKKYREEIRQSYLENIELLGYVSDEKVRNFYESSDLVTVLAKYGEGFGLPIIEAYLYDKPVFASDICAIPEIIINKNFLVKNNVEDLENKIKKYYEGISNYNFKKYYEENFSYDKILEKYRKMYSEIF
jgi:hypothetical protein